MSSDNKNKAGGGSNSWSRPLSKGEGGSRFPKRGEGGGSSGGSGSRPPPGMEGGRSNSNSNKDFVGGEPSSSSSRRTSSGGSGGWGNSNNRSASSSNPNGYARKTAGTAAAAAASTSTNSSSPANDVLRDRFLHLMLSMVGQTVTVTTTTGQVLEGIFHTFSPFEVNKGLVNNDMQNIYCFKAVRVIKKGNDESDSSFKNGSTVLIPTYKVANVQVKSMRLDVVNANEAAATTVASPTNNTEDAAFQTDSQISGGRGGNQNLVAAGSAWTSVGDGGLGGGLDDDSDARATGATTAGNGKGSDALNWRRAASGSSGARSAPSSGGLPKTSGDMKGSIGDWDQFSANEKKFGVKTNFDENLYTTKLDMKNIDEKRHAEAERIAAEIEGTVSTNIHIATERNQAIAMDYDDEDLYSGVLTKDLKARAVPDNEKKSGKVMNYAAAAQAAAKKGKSSVDNATEGSGAKDGGARKSQVSDTEALSDLSKVNVSSKEKKVESENETTKDDKAAATDKTTDATKSDTDDNEKDGEAEKKDEKKTETKLKLNPNAKSFSFNPSAKTFTPSFTNPPAAPAAPMQPLPPMDGQMMPPHPQEYPGGPPMMGGMGHQYAPMPGEYRFIMFLL